MTNDGSQDQAVPEVVLGRDDLGGRQRAGVEEDRDQREPHRDLVGDHLRARAQAAEQGVRRAAGPAAEHDAVDADRGDRHHEQHGHRHVGELQRRLDAPKHVDLGAERDHREGHERRHRRDDRREEEDRLVGGLGDDVLLERQLHAVGERLEQAEGAVHVGADAVLHPGHHPALPPDVEQREQHQDHEDQHGLDQDDPPRVVAELLAGRAACHRVRGSCVRSLHGDPAAGRGQVGEHAVAGELAGTQTTPSARSATSAGSVHRAAVAGERDRVAVARRTRPG